MKSTKKYANISEEEMFALCDRVAWQPLFDFVKTKYGITGNTTLKLNAKSHTFSLTWDENVADKCGIIGSVCDNAYLCSWESGFFQWVSDSDIVLSPPHVWCNIVVQYHMKGEGSHTVKLFRAEYSKENGWVFSPSIDN